MSIELALKSFVNAFKKSDQSMGSIEYVEYEKEIETINLKVKGQLYFFYKHLTLKDKPTLGGDFFMQLFEPKQLNDALKGWLWVDDLNQKDPNWSENYIIFAERNGDVIFCDCSLEECPVYGSIQKKNYKLSSSLEKYLETITLAMNIEENEFNNETCDDDFNFLQDYISSVRSKILGVISPECTENFINFYFN